MTLHDINAPDNIKTRLGLVEISLSAHTETLDTFLRLLKLHQNTLQVQQKNLEAFQHLMLEQEMRIKSIEASLNSATLYEKIKMPTEN